MTNTSNITPINSPHSASEKTDSARKAHLEADWACDPHTGTAIHPSGLEISVTVADRYNGFAPFRLVTEIVGVVPDTLNWRKKPNILKGLMARSKIAMRTALLESGVEQLSQTEARIQHITTTFNQLDKGLSRPVNFMDDFIRVLNKIDGPKRVLVSHLSGLWSLTFDRFGKHDKKKKELQQLRRKVRRGAVLIVLPEAPKKYGLMVSQGVILTLTAAEMTADQDYVEKNICDARDPVYREWENYPGILAGEAAKQRSKNSIKLKVPLFNSPP